MNNNILRKINNIQSDEKQILMQILNIVLSNNREKELISEIIASFIDINKRFEAIKVKQLSNEQKKNISTTLNTYSKSITQLKSTVNSAVGSLHAHSSV